MKQKRQNKIRWWLVLAMCCISITSQSATINIQGLNAIGTYQGYPLFEVSTPSITVSSSSGEFDYVYIDDVQIAYNSDSYWSSYSVDVKRYMGPHKLQLKRSSSDYGICYFQCGVDSSINGIWYEVDNETACVAVARIDLENAEILSEYVVDDNTYPVTAIKKSAFSGCSNLTTVSIPNTVTSIGESAFYNCSSLASITIPESVTAIGTSAFNGCSSLASLTFNAANCGTCGSSSYPAFPSSITSLTFGDKVTKIPAYFLYNGSHIENVTIPNSVTTIDNYAFRNCSSLKSITLGSGLLKIEYTSFYGCNIVKAFWLGNTPPTGVSNVSSKVNYVANDRYTFSNRLIYKFLSSKFSVDGTVYVPISPSDRTCDVVDCLYNSENRTVTISDKVSNRGIEMKVNDIRKYAFYNNMSIENLTISNNGSIGDYAFNGCTNLQTATVSNQGSIGGFAFSGCTNLQTTDVSNQGNIEYYAFSDCINLQTVDVSNQGSIGGSAFSGCTKLQTATVSNHGNIGDYAFSGCTNLQMAIVSSQGNIGDYAFNGCTNLQTATVTNRGSIGNYAFSGCVELEDLTLGDEVTGIFKYAFNGCSSIPRLSIPNSVTQLGQSAFENCSSLESVQIGTRIPSLPTRLFAGCSSLKSITVPNNVNSIGDNAFKGCRSLADVTFEDFNEHEEESTSQTFLTLGSNGGSPMFADCPLDEVYVGRRLSYKTSSSYGYSPFYRNTSLRTVEITDAETQIYDNEFYGCSNLKSLKIGNGVKTIGKWAFSGCSSLDYFSAGCMVESIGEEAFSDCTGLTKYYSYSANPPVCGSQALDDINKWDCTLYVPVNSNDEYRDASQWKDFFFLEEMNAVLVAEIRLNVTEIEMNVGETFKLAAEVLPSDATNQELIYTSSNPECVTVDSDGNLSALADGTSTIMVKSSDGNSEVSCPVTVKSITVIDGIVTDLSRGVYQVFNLQGIPVLKTTNLEDIKRLPAGIYIVNGKKVAVR